MRKHIINFLEEYTKNNNNTIIVTADLGYNVFDSYKNNYPNNFYNVGIAEQCMAGVSAGLALEGNTVIMYSIGNFCTLRCIEQIRNCICYHHANVKIISVGGGFSYAQLGMTHHATETIGIMNSLPYINIYAPSDPIMAEYAICDAINIKEPCYIQLEKNNEQIIPNISQYDTDIVKIRDGKHIAVFGYGTVINEAIQIDGIGIFSVLKIKPFNIKKFLNIIKNYQIIITIEEHNVKTGLGSILSNALTENNIYKKIYKIGLNDQYVSVVGDRKYLRDIYNINTNQILKIIKENE